MSSYVILIKYTHEGACLDSFLDVSLLFKHGSPANALVVEKVRAKLGQPTPAGETIDSLVRRFYSLDMRTRFDGAAKGPYLIHVDDVLTPEDVMVMLQDPEALAKIRQGHI